MVSVPPLPGTVQSTDAFPRGLSQLTANLSMRTRLGSHHTVDSEYSRPTCPREADLAHSTLRRCWGHLLHFLSWSVCQRYQDGRFCYHSRGGYPPAIFAHKVPI